MKHVELLQRFDKDASLIHWIVWSDESTFTLAGTVNRHNCVLSSLTITNILRSKTTCNTERRLQSGPASLIIGPIFIEGTVNADVYLNILQEHVFSLNQNL